MREYAEELNGTELRLVANFAASVKISENVADPMMIAREANLEAMFLEQGMPYTPRWHFTVKNIVELLFIGVQEGGSDMKKSDLEELVFEAGFARARDLCVEYLALIVGPSPENFKEDESSEGN